MSVLGGIAFALALTLPGLALMRREEWRRAEPLELAGIAFAGSAAVWAVLLWLLPWLHVSLTAAVLGGTALAAGVLAIARRADVVACATAIWVEPRAWLELGAVVAVLAARAGFAFTRLASSVGDMTAHAYMAELIYLRDGLPESHEPLLPIQGFGQFSPGFHALAAMESLLVGVPTYRAVIHVLCLTLAAMTFTLYTALRGLGVARGPAALGAAGALFLARNPQFFEQWGGAPTLLAAAIVFLVFRDGMRLAEPLDVGLPARMGLLGAGAVLSHLLPVASFLYVAGVGVLLRIAIDRRGLRRAATNAVAAAAVGGALVLPFLHVTPIGVTPRIADWAHAWFRQEMAGALALQAPLLGPGAGARTWPFYVVVYLGLLPVALLAVGLAVHWVREPGLATSVATALVAMHALLFAGGLGEFLPLWSSLYPTRIGIWLAIPLGVAIAGLASAAPRLPHRAWVAAGLAWLAAFGVEGWRMSRAGPFGTFFYEAVKSGRAPVAAVLANEAVGGAFWVATLCRDNAVLTADDLAAFAWIRDRTPPGAVFATNYGDGGNLITAVAHRKVLEPHYYWFFYADQYEAWRRLARIDYVFVGSEQSPAWLATYTYHAATLDRDPGVELVFRAGNARVYRVKT